MKNIIRFIVMISFVAQYGCKTQSMVQNTKNVFLLKENENQFINKPLKKVLSEIKPQITTADANNDNPYYFSFRFRTLEQQRKNKGSLEDSVSLYVYVETPIDWKYEERPKGKEVIWTKEDAKKYGNLIVTRIKVINKN